MTFTWGNAHVHKTVQCIVRKHVAPADFRLTHVWVDLAHNYQRNGKAN